MVGMSIPMAQASYSVTANKLKPLTKKQTVHGRPTFHLEVSSSKKFFHVFFLPVQLQSLCLSLRQLHIFPTITYPVL